MNDGSTVLDTNTGDVNSTRTVGVDGLTLDAVERMELEVNFNGSGEGIVIDAENVTVEDIALRGADQIAASSGAQIYVTENVMAGGEAIISRTIFGARADGSDPGASSGNSSMLVNGAATISNNYLAFTNASGIRFNGMANGNSSAISFINNEIYSVGGSHAAGDAATIDSTDVTFQGNYIHDVIIQSSVLPYNGKGVELWYDANNNLVDNNTIIGAVTAGIGVGDNANNNVISKNIITGTTGLAGNGGAGILITNAGTGGDPTGNTISQNEIYNNAGIGIDIDNTGTMTTAYGDDVDANDGSTNLGSTQDSVDHPVIEIANLASGNLSLSGYIGTAAGQTDFAGARIEFFIAATDASGYGEGRTYLGFMIALPNGTFSGTLSGAGVTDANLITATTTLNGSTSEFGLNKGVNTAPTDINPNGFSIDENNDTTTPVSLGTLSTTDADSADPSESFTYSIVPGDDGALFSIGGTDSDELLISDGILDFETQSSYTVTVRVTDSGGFAYDETMTITVNDLNEVPTAIGPTTLSVDENTNASSGISVATLTTTDQDGGETFSYAVVGGADAANFSIGGTSSDELILTSSDLDFETQSTYVVDVEVTDSGGLTHVETITINLNDLNENPTIAAQTFDVDEHSPNGTSVGFVESDDVDAGDSVGYLVTGGTGATAFSVDPSTGEILIVDDSQIDFEVNPTFTLVIEVTDSGGLTDEATITINLNDINDEQYVVNNAQLVLNEGATAVIDTTLLLTSDQDHDANELTYTVTSAPSNGTLLLNGVASSTFTQDDIDNNRVTYAHSGSETTSDSFLFSVDDGIGAATNGTFVIGVNSVNDAPVAVSDSLTTDEGGTINGTSSDLLGNDSDAENDPLTATLISDVTNGTLTLNPDGSFTYTHDGSETTSDSFQYRVNDGQLDSNVVTVSINVIPVNDAPNGADDNYSAITGFLLEETNGVLVNDFDAENDPLTAVLTTSPSNGTLVLNSNGTFTYMPDS